MAQIHTIYFIHHSHTDIGYTHDQPIVWDLHTRFIDQAITAAEQYTERDTDGAFKWTVETTRVFKEWLMRASDAQIDRFKALEQAGRIEVTGMFANITPLYDTDQLIESLQLVGWLRSAFGFDIRHAMNCDVNGQNWPLVDVLLDAGIEGFTMAINTHFGGALTPRPLPFLWEGPSGRTLPTYNGWTYDKGWTWGIGRDLDEFGNTWWPRVQAHLDSIGYPLPILMLQSYHPFGDNGSAFGHFTQFIDDWNAAGRTPRIVMATPRIWWQAIAECRDQLPTWRGDWTDFWNFGCISSAREQALNRQSRACLRSADALFAAVNALGVESEWAHQTFDRYRTQAWEALHLWDEHTWGADCAVFEPEHIDTHAQWNYKANYAYTAHSLSLMLQRDAIADLASHIRHDDDHKVLLFNPLPWARTISGDVGFFVPTIRGRADDSTAGRHFQDHGNYTSPAFKGIHPRLTVPPIDVPGLGYVALRESDLIDLRISSEVSEETVIDTPRYRATFDRDNGGITSLYDKSLGWEWVDQTAKYAFNTFVYEQVAGNTEPWPRNLFYKHEWGIDNAEIPSGWKTGWPAKRTYPTEVLSHQVVHHALGHEITQTLRTPGFDGVVTQRVWLPNYADYIECESFWEMGLNTHPEATYILFPCNVPHPQACFDLGGQAVIPHEEQLPGACRDWFTAQGWVDFSNGERGITFALPDNPMFQMGDFHFGDYQSSVKLDRALLLGWVTNNYWETNFRAHQPGRVTARYRLLPYGGAFDETRAHQFGLEAMHSQPVLQNLDVPTIAEAGLAVHGALLTMPEPPVFVLHTKAAVDGTGLIVRLLNASDASQSARIGSALLKIGQAQQCNLFEQPLNDLTIQDGAVIVDIPPRRLTVVRLDVAFA